MNQLLSITACACLTALAAAWPGASRAEPAVDLAAVLQAALGRTEAAPAAQRAVQRRQAELARAEAAFDWQLQARASVERRDVIVERNGFLTSDTDTETFFSSQLGARRQLRNGISIAPALRLTSGLDDADEAVGGLGSGIGLGLEMPLLRGAGRPAAVAAEEAAREQLRAAESELEFARQRELVAAATGYWDALAARAEEQAAERLLELAERGATLVEALVRQGEADEGRLASWRSDAAKRRLELNVARQQVQLAGIALARQLGRPTHGEALPEVAGGLPAPAAPSAVDAAYLAGLVEQAYRQRPDLRALAQHRQAAEARLAVASDGTRPQLNLLLDADAVTLAYARSLGGAPEHAELAVAEVDVAELLAHEAALREQIALELQRLLLELQLLAENHRLAQATASEAQARAQRVAQRVAAGQADFAAENQAATEAILGELQVSRLRHRHLLALAELRLGVGGLGTAESPATGQLVDSFQQLPKP